MVCLWYELIMFTFIMLVHFWCCYWPITDNYYVKVHVQSNLTVSSSSLVHDYTLL